MIWSETFKKRLEIFSIPAKMFFEVFFGVMNCLHRQNHQKNPIFFFNQDYFNPRLPAIPRQYLNICWKMQRIGSLLSSCTKLNPAFQSITISFRILDFWVPEFTAVAECWLLLVLIRKLLALFWIVPPRNLDIFESIWKVDH